jgi:hypothetical protein
MVLIKFDNEINVQSLFRVSKLVIILHLYWKENPDTLTIDVINQTLLRVSVWSMSHFRSSMQGNTRVLLATMCKYDLRMFGKTSSSSFLISGSLCGIYSRNSSLLIFLKSSPQCGSTALPPVFSSVSPKAKG